MSKSSSSKRRGLWRADWFVGAWIVAAVAMPWTSGVFESLEVRFHDVPSTRFLRQPADRVAFTAITSTSACAIPLDGGMVTSSYDPPAKAAAADDPFARTAVFRRPGGPAHPEGGEGQSASEA